MTNGRILYASLAHLTAPKEIRTIEASDWVSLLVHFISSCHGDVSFIRINHALS